MRIESGQSAAATRPLVATIERISTAGNGESGINLSLGPPHGPEWFPAADLAGNRDLLEEMMSRAERGCGVENRPYAATSLLRMYLWHTLVSVVAAFLMERRLPDIRAGNVWVRFDDGGLVSGAALIEPRLVVLPDDSEAGHPDVLAVLSEEGMLGWLRDALAETHLPVLISALQALRVRRGRRALWSVAADVCADAFMYVGQDLGRGDEGRACAERLLDGPPPLAAPANYIVLEQDGSVIHTRVRNTCCLYYKLGQKACLTCPRVTDEERRVRLAKG